MKQVGAVGSMPRDITDWLKNPVSDRGIYFSSRDEWVYHSYESLAHRARRTAWRLRQSGVKPGAVVMLAHGNTPNFIGSFFGSILAGAVPAPLAPFSAFKSLAEYHDFLAQVARITDSRVIMAEPNSAGAAESVMRRGSHILDSADSEDVPECEAEVEHGAVAYLQFSSGSQGFPRAARVTHSAITANVTAICRWLKVGPDDSLATWLPLYHDMGLVGGCLCPAMEQADVYMMRPEDFIRSPQRWLRCFAEKGATIGMIPPFGLAQIARRVPPKALTGMDFSSWRALIIGSERVDREMVARVTSLLEPANFNAQAMTPAYGMAEAVLMATACNLTDEVHSVFADSAQLMPGQRVSVSARRSSDSHVELVSCGRPLPGTDVSVVAEDGALMPEGVLGEIKISGDSVTGGYLGSEAGPRPAQEEFGSQFMTGDSGFILGGELYVIGRIGDSVKVLGRWLHAEDISDVVARAVPTGRPPVVLLGSTAGSNTALILIDRGLADQGAEIGRLVCESFAGLRVMVVVTRPAEILRTTSGKPRRSLIWRWFTTAELADRTVWDSQVGQLGQGRTR